jgi:omega-amidase
MSADSSIVEHLRLALIQSPLHWCNPEANRQQFSRVLQAIDPVDLIVLPEMFSTGFAIQEPNAAETTEDSLRWMQQLAAEKTAAVVGTIFTRVRDKLYNRLYFVYPDAQYQVYDKRHLFVLSGEDKTLTAGTAPLFVSYKGWRIQCIICFDLRFPVWCRNPSQETADLMLVPANWPDRRIEAWRILLQARAIENQLYVAGINRSGIDGQGIPHSGHSMIVQPDGQIMCEETQQTAVIYQTITKEEIHKTRTNLPFLQSADSFHIITPHATSE